MPVSDKKNNASATLSNIFSRDALCVLRETNDEMLEKVSSTATIEVNSSTMVF